MAIKKNLENFSLRNIKENKITTIGAKLDKNVALETVVSLIDQCQQIKSNEKKIPEIKIIKNLSFKTGKFTFSIIFSDPNIKKKGRLTNILKKAVIIGSTSESRTNIGEKAILTAPIISIRKGLIFKLGKNFFRFFFFYNWKMDDCRKQRNYYRHYPGYIE